MNNRLLTSTSRRTCSARRLGANRSTAEARCSSVRRPVIYPNSSRSDPRPPKSQPRALPAASGATCAGAGRHLARRRDGNLAGEPSAPDRHRPCGLPSLRPGQVDAAPERRASASWDRHAVCGGGQPRWPIDRLVWERGAHRSGGGILRVRGSTV